METIVINKKNEGGNTPKFKYKFSSSEAIVLYAIIYVILFISCKIIDKFFSTGVHFYEWYPIVIPYICTAIFIILFLTKLVLTKISDFFKKYVILVETITIFQMWYGTYSISGLKNHLGQTINEDIVAIGTLVLQLIVMGVGLLICKYRAKKFIDINS